MMEHKQETEVVNRLNKIEGQIRGILKMVNDKRYCIDILIQTRAVISAIMKVEDLILYQHLNTCVVDSMKSDNEEDKKQKIDEISKIFSKFRKGG